MKKKKIIKRVIIISLIVVAISFGIIKFLLPSGANNTPVDTNGAKTQTIEKPSSGSPADYSANENLYIAAWIIENATTFKTHSVGAAKAKSLGINVDQIVNDRRIKANGLIFTEAISYSAFKSVAEQRYFTEDMVYVRTGKAKNATTVSWKDSVKNYNDKEFADEYGCYVNSIHKYILNDETIISSSFIGRDEDGNFIFNYKVNELLGTALFSREVKHMSGSSIYPKFHSAEVTLTIASDFTPISIRTNDNYDVKAAGLDANTNNDLTEYFDVINGEVELPEMDFFKPYIEGSLKADNPGEEVLDTMDYLGNAFAPYLANKGNFRLKFNYNNNDIYANLGMDISKMEFNVLLDNGYYFKYADDKIYFMLDSFTGYASINSFMDKIDLEQENSLSSIDLASLLDNASIVDDNNVIILTLPIDLMGIKATAIFNMHYEDSIIVFDNLTATINYNGIEIKASMNPINEDIAYPQTTNISNDLSGISDFIPTILNIATHEGLSLQAKANIEGVDINTNIIYENNKIKAIININYNNNKYQIELVIIDGYAYLKFEDTTVKLQIQEVINYINKYIELPSFDPDCLKDFNPISILGGLTVKNGTLELRLFLDIINENLNTVILKANQIDDNSLLLTANMYDLKLILSSTDEKIVINQNEYADLTGHLMVDEIINLIKNDQIKIMIEKTKINNIEISGYIDYILSENYLYGYLLIDEQEIEICYDKDIFLKYKDLCVKVTKDEIMELTELLPESDFSIPSIIVNTDDALNVLINNLINISIKNVLDKFILTENNYGLSFIIENSEITKHEFTSNATIEDIKPIINNFLQIYNNGYASITLHEKTIVVDNTEIKYSGTILANLKDLSLKGNINIFINDYKFENIELWYVNNVIYLQYGNIKLQGNINELMNIINEFITISTSSTFDFSISYNEALNIYLNNYLITIKNDLDLLIDSEYLSVTIASAQAFEISAPADFENLNNLRVYIPFIKELLDKKALAINNLNAYVTINGTAIEIIDSSIKLNINDMSIEAILNIKAMGTINKLYVTYINDKVYVSYDEALGISLSINEINALVDELMTRFNIENKTNEITFNFEELINSLLLTDGLSLGLKLGELNITLRLNEDLSLTIDSFVYNNIIIDEASLAIEVINPFIPTIKEMDYKDYNELINIIDFVSSIIELAQNKAFNFEYAAKISAYTYQNNEQTSYSVNTRTLSGNINIVIKENNNICFNLFCYMTEDVYYYENSVLTSHTTQTHTINLSIIDNKIYCTYYSDKGSDANKIKLKMDIPTIMTLVKTASNMFNLDIPFIDNLDSIDSLDTGVFDQIMPSTSSSGTLINPASFIRSLNATANSLELTLNKDAINFNDDLTITINKDASNIYSMALNTMRITDNNKATVCEDIIISLVDNNYIELTEPSNKDQYDDFSSIDDFLKSILETAKLKDTGFHIEGKAKMTFESSFLNSIMNFLADLPDLDLLIDVSVDDKGLPIIYAKISNIKKLEPLFGTVSLFKEDTTSEIYYKDGLIYTIRTLNPGKNNQTVEKKVRTLSYFGNNALDEVVYLFNFGSTIVDAINNATPDANYPRRLDTVYKKYSSSTNSYSVSLSGSHLIEGSEVGDINLTLLSNANNQLAQITGNVKLVSIINFDIDLGLKNIGQVVTVTVPSKEDFTEIK